MSTPRSAPLLLIIDDEIAIRDSIAAYFEDCGFRVMGAGSGNEGIRTVRARRPDAVISDLRMPDGNGLEVLDAVKALDDTIPVVILSGVGVLDEAIEALRRGAWDYIAKPIHDMVELELIIERGLERSGLLRENRSYNNELELLVTARTNELKKLSKAVEQSANSVVITDVNGVIEYVNPKFCEVTGYTFDEALGNTPRVLNSGRQQASYYQGMWDAIRNGLEWRGEFCNKTKDGTLFWEMCSIAPLRDDNGAVTHYVAIKEDITDRKRAEEQLYFQANHDIQTGLPNRFRLQQHLATHMCDTRFMGILLIDLDRFKFINDTFGHKTGDELLKAVAQRLTEICGTGYMVARFVGDEFVIVPPPAGAAIDIVSVAERVRSAMGTPFTIGDTEVITTASIGVVLYPEEGECVESLLRNAEAAMYQAKKDGRNNIAYYTREMNQRMERRLSLETRLHRALERGEFSLHYQPQVSMSGLEVTGMEALLRWAPPGEPPVSPVEFIPLLEESGLIVAVGEWVLWQACSQCIRWQGQGLKKLRLSVNISALQFMRSDLDVTVRRVLAVTGLDPHLLCLELTESMIMVDSVRTMEKLNTLRELGITLSLDDFGTGYSSLEYLGRLPIHELKIDRSFVNRMMFTGNDAAVVNTIIAMGQALGMELVAEGVENGEQLQYLHEKLCGTIQGYLFSKPLPAEEFAAFITGWNPALAAPDTVACHMLPAEG